MRSFDDFAVRAAALSDTRDCDRGIGTFFFERNERPLTPICPASSLLGFLTAIVERLPIRKDKEP